MPILVIAAYHCEVAGDPTDDVDYQVRYFTGDAIDEVMSRLRDEPSQTYQNSNGEEVRWIFDRTVAAEVDPVLKDGAEVIGFITGGADRNHRTRAAQPWTSAIPIVLLSER